MKATHIFSMAGMATAIFFSSCSQNPTNGYDSGTETARAIADDEIPAWMAESSDGAYDSNYHPVKEEKYAYNPPTKPKTSASKSSKSSSSKAQSSAKSSSSKKTTKPRTTTYTVKKGDTLGSIARRNGSSVKAIKSANKLKSDLIRINQKLVIPRSK